MKQLIRFALILFCCHAGLAQTAPAVTKVTNWKLTSAINGTTCTFAKVAGSTVGLQSKCVSGDKTTTLTSTLTNVPGGSPSQWELGWNTVLCYVYVNPTIIPMPAGSLGTAPVNGITYQTQVDGILGPFGIMQWP